jgi:hypothetical protein
MPGSAVITANASSFFSNALSVSSCSFAIEAARPVNRGRSS